MAAANPSWGYGHIHGELKGLGYDVSWQTVRRVMLDHGLLPDPDKPYKTTWKTFLRSHWESLAACDFFTVEAWGLKGLVRYFVFFVPLPFGVFGFGKDFHAAISVSLATETSWA
jgi:putative transposase